MLDMEGLEAHPQEIGPQMLKEIRWVNKIMNFVASKNCADRLRWENVSLRFNRATVIGFSATRTRVQLTFQELKFPGQKSLVSELDKKIVTISTNKLSEALTVLLEEWDQDQEVSEDPKFQMLRLTICLSQLAARSQRGPMIATIQMMDRIVLYVSNNILAQLRIEIYHKDWVAV
jgi:hypothetical protein